MSISYEQTGRVHQKGRTRDALVDGARRLMDQGIIPTVEQAAAAASVSRPTAYRYFRNRQALLKATHPEITAPSLLPEDGPSSPVERLERVAEILTRLVLKNEVALRAMLRASLESAGNREELAMRTGRRVIWVSDALAPLKDRFKPKAFRNLVLRISAVLGIECLVWLTDIAGITQKEAAGLMQQSAMEILTAALRGD